MILQEPGERRRLADLLAERETTTSPDGDTGSRHGPTPPETIAEIHRQLELEQHTEMLQRTAEAEEAERGSAQARQQMAEQEAEIHALDVRDNMRRVTAQQLARKGAQILDEHAAELRQLAEEETGERGARQAHNVTQIRVETRDELERRVQPLHDQAQHERHVQDPPAQSMIPSRVQPADDQEDAHLSLLRHDDHTREVKSTGCWVDRASEAGIADARRVFQAQQQMYSTAQRTEMQRLQSESASAHRTNVTPEPSKPRLTRSPRAGETEDDVIAEAAANRRSIERYHAELARLGVQDPPPRRSGSTRKRRSWADEDEEDRDTTPGTTTPAFPDVEPDDNTGTTAPGNDGTVFPDSTGTDSPALPYPYFPENLQGIPPDQV